MLMTEKQFLLEIRPSKNPGTTVFRISGPLVLEHLFRFQEVWRSHHEQFMILDMSKLSYIDSASLGFLVKAYVTREKNGKKLVLAGVTGFAKEILAVTKVGSIFEIYPSVEAAESALSRVRRVAAS
jgi:anti-sigma B factor antagonist